MASQMQMDNMADILKMKGYFESKDFENLYEPGEQFANLRDFALQILTQKIDRMNRVSSNEKVRAGVNGALRRLGNSLVRMAGVRRLGQLEMRAKQYYSATIAQLANLNARSQQFLTEQIALFSVGMNTRVQKNAKYRNALISASLTSARGGLSKTGMEPLYDLKYEKSKDPYLKTVNGVLDKVDQLSDGILRVTLTSTDVLAAQNTFLAFYMDYVTSRNPELADMTNDEFFEYAAKNIDTKAIAYADDQVGRSQTQSDEWNSRGIYGQGNSNTKRILANSLFTFGRFQNNRKVGIANDISILNSDLASERDKTQAANRLTSAAIEIGIFKILSPVIGVAYGKALLPFFSSILGFDEEVDEMAKKAMDSFGRSGDEKVRGELEFALSKYKRNISKEFGNKDGKIKWVDNAEDDLAQFVKDHPEMASIAIAAGYNPGMHGSIDSFFGWYIESILQTGGLGMLGELLYNSAAQADNGQYGFQRMLSYVFGPSVDIGVTGWNTISAGQEFVSDAAGADVTNAKRRTAIRSLLNRIPFLGGNRSFREQGTNILAGEADDNKQVRWGNTSGFSGGFGSATF